MCTKEQEYKNTNIPMSFLSLTKNYSSSLMTITPSSFGSYSLKNKIKQNKTNQKNEFAFYV